MFNTFCCDFGKRCRILQRFSQGCGARTGFKTPFWGHGAGTGAEMFSTHGARADLEI